jgi:hypothetical protein
MLPLGDVAINHHKTGARHRVAAHLDDAAVGPGVLETQFLIDRGEAAAQFRIVLRAEFATLGEGAKAIGIGGPLLQERVGQVEDALEIQVPGGQPQFTVEHRNAVAHIVKGDAQLGLALADLVQQPRIIYRDHRLSGEAFEQSNFLFRERPHFQPVCGNQAEQHALFAQRYG